MPVAQPPMPVAELPSLASLPHEVTSKLASVRLRIRSVDLALAIERAILALVGSVVISFVLDTALEPELAVRRPFTYFLLLSAFATTCAFIAIAFRRRLTDDAVAVLVEQVYPELEDGLVSSVQLSRDLANGGLGHTSPALIRSVIARTAAKAEGLDFGRVVDPSPLLPATFLTFLAVGGVALFCLQSATQPLARAWFERCILGNEVAYPKTVSLEVTVAGEKDGVTAVARGDDVTVDIAIPKGQRKVEKLVVRTYPLKKEEGSETLYAHGRPEETRLMQVGGSAEAHYRKIYQNVTEPFDFLVDAGNHVTSSKHRVLVVDRPRIEEAKFWLSFPEYMSIAATPREKPEMQPDLRVPVGTEIEYRVVANKALKKADLVFEFDDTNAPKPLAGQAVPVISKVADPAPVLGGKEKQGKRVLSGKFTVKSTMRFRYSLISEEGYDDGKKPVVFSVTAVIDRPPEVKIVVPGRPKQVTPRAIVPLEIDVKDDYGAVSAGLRLKIESQEAVPASQAPGETKIELAGLEDGAKSALLKYRLDLAELGLRPGDKVVYKAVAFDRNIDLDKRMGESQSFTLQVVAPEDLARILQDRLQRLKDELIATAKLEKQARDDTETMIRPLVAKTKLDEEDKRRLLLADYEQRKVTSRLTSAAQELERLVEERELNRLGDERELDREKEIRDAAKELAEKAAPVVSFELDKVRQAPELDEHTKARLSKVPDLQEDVEKAILALAARIEKWADFADVIREVRDILTEHERVTNGTEAELKKANPSGGNK